MRLDPFIDPAPAQDRGDWLLELELPAGVEVEGAPGGRLVLRKGDRVTLGRDSSCTLRVRGTTLGGRVNLILAVDSNGAARLHHTGHTLPILLNGRPARDAAIATGSVIESPGTPHGVRVRLRLLHEGWEARVGDVRWRKSNASYDYWYGDTGGAVEFQIAVCSDGGFLWHVYSGGLPVHWARAATVPEAMAAAEKWLRARPPA